eukprot:CAMPEP_0171455794 /NCGR_PEP_ID=MMETSP0945-20130129/2544_1 /TAXON_ID=109269 /ORGANISM="Vaucheria litorea, Strain CCMP2940" /LENGTH=74 /DNA_ID=CAMNT_0011981101 /DNA_START=144 /DNA_END=368 /DNA_ORIENTATION=+
MIIECDDESEDFGFFSTMSSPERFDVTSDDEDVTEFSTSEGEEYALSSLVFPPINVSKKSIDISLLCKKLLSSC